MSRNSEIWSVTHLSRIFYSIYREDNNWLSLILGGGDFVDTFNYSSWGIKNISTSNFSLIGIIYRVNPTYSLM
jgi:hypothetical protein